jgi:hypothetical protein
MGIILLKAIHLFGHHYGELLYETVSVGIFYNYSTKLELLFHFRPLFLFIIDVFWQRDIISSIGVVGDDLTTVDNVIQSTMK